MSEKKFSKIELFTPIHVIDLDLEKSSIHEFKYIETNTNNDCLKQTCDLPIGIHLHLNKFTNNFNPVKKSFKKI